MNRILILAGLVLAAPLVAQVEHAPTVAQCQADQRLWISRIEEGDSTKLPRWDVLSGWYTEITDCEEVDPTHRWDYYNLAAEISATQGRRMYHFIKSHAMWQKFLDEDAAGKR